MVYSFYVDATANRQKNERSPVEMNEQEATTEAVVD